MCFSKFVRKDITVADRITIARLALTNEKETTSSQLARAYKTSRKFISEQITRAEATLAEEFSVKRDKNPAVDLSKERIVRAVGSSALDCHSSVRGIVEQLEAVGGIQIRDGNVAEILKESARKAEPFNKEQDLSSVCLGAHDEIFSQQQAVLDGVQVHSSYLYLLESPGGRDSTNWGLMRLDKQSEQKLELELVVADAAKGLRGGARELYPKVRIGGDVFHAIDKINDECRRLENRAYDFLGQQYELERQALKRQKKGKDRRGYHGKLYRIRRKAQPEIQAFDLTHLLSHWMKEFLQLSGYQYQPRRSLYDWIVSELKKIQAQQVKSLVTYLPDEKDALLEFVKSLDEELSQIKEPEQIHEQTLTWLREQRLYLEKESRYWKLEGK